MVGDSKAQGQVGSVYEGGTQIPFGNLVGGKFNSVDALPGFGVGAIKTGIDTWLASQGSGIQYVICDMGVNDFIGPTSQASFEADYGYILDAIHVKWPSAFVYCIYQWKSGADALANTFAGYLDNIISTRNTYSFIGCDDRVILPGNTSDGIHPTSVGYRLRAVNIKVVWDIHH